MNNNLSLYSFFYKRKKIIYAVALLFTILFFWLYLPLSWDDSYISFRYALNLVNGNHWNWNNDNNVVEAYTNFSYAALSVIPILLKIDPTLFFKFLNLLWLLIIFLRLKKDLLQSSLFFISMIILIFNPYLHYHAATGMETIFFIFLIFESGRLVIKKNDLIKSEIYLFLFLLLLLPLTRPEGLLYSIMFFLLFKKTYGNSLKFNIVLIAVICIAVMYMIWRYSYFGKLFPNTFYLKSVKGIGFGNFLKFFDEAKIYLFVLTILNVLVRNKLYLIFSVLTVVIALFVYAPSDLNTTINDRFTIQIFLPIYLLSFYLVNQAYDKILFVMFLVFIIGRFYDYPKIASLNPQSFYYKEIGKTLSKYSKNNYKLMLGEAGIIPYFSGLQCFDFIGLANSELSTNKLTIDYVRKISPDIIFLYGAGENEDNINLNFYSQDVIVNYMKETNSYEFVGNLNNRDWCLKVFIHKSLPDYNSLNSELKIKLDKTYEFDGMSLYNKKNIYNWFTLKYIN
jgi:arabinofuranosyltransferase